MCFERIMRNRPFSAMVIQSPSTKYCFLFSEYNDQFKKYSHLFLQTAHNFVQSSLVYLHTLHIGSGVSWCGAQVTPMGTTTNRALTPNSLFLPHEIPVLGGYVSVDKKNRKE
jgi:hypothetical protein